MSMDRVPGNVMKDESAPDVKTTGFQPGTQWSDVECSTTRPSAPRSQLQTTLLSVYLHA